LTAMTNMMRAISHSRRSVRYLVASVGVILSTNCIAETLRYDIDPIATKTSYETKYLGFIKVRGVFEKMTGALQYDATKPVLERNGSIHVVIDATTIKPSNFDSDAKRQMMRGPDFFNVEKYRTIEFKSSKFRFEGDKLIAIDGMVTLVGVTKPATLNVKKSRCEPAAMLIPARCTASVEWIVKRFEFGINGWANTVSDEVKIAVDLVATAAAASASASADESTKQ
jgi:polyisoprenoid-binding protein YceI